VKRLSIFNFLMFTIFLFSLIDAVYGNESVVNRVDYFEAKMFLAEVLTDFDKKFQELNYDSERNRVVIKIETIIDKIESYLESGQEDAQANYDLGMTYFLAKRMEIVNDFGQSNSYYKKAIRINPNYEEARVLLARNFMEEKQYAEALEQSIYLLEHDIRDDALKLVAVAKMHMRRFNEAKNDLEKYLEKYPHDESAKALVWSIKNGKAEGRIKAIEKRYTVIENKVTVVNAQ